MAISRSEFEELVERLKRERSLWFELDSDPPATDAEIGAAEAAMGLTFPDEYRYFLRRFGAGYFAFGNVFSARESSDWNVAAKNAAARRVVGDDLLAVSENGVGDYYGFAVASGRCEAAVVFWDHETGTVSWAYDTFLDFIVSVALTP